MFPFRRATTLGAWHNTRAARARLYIERIHCLLPGDAASHQMDVQLWEAEGLDVMFSETQRPLHGPDLV